MSDIHPYRQGHAPILMKPVATRKDVRAPGQFVWFEENGAPCVAVAIPSMLQPNGYDVALLSASQGRWDANRARPTFGASILTPSGWQGWIRYGHLLES